MGTPMQTLFLGYPFPPNYKIIYNNPPRPPSHFLLTHGRAVQGGEWGPVVSIVADEGEAAVPGRIAGNCAISVRRGELWCAMTVEFPRSRWFLPHQPPPLLGWTSASWRGNLSKGLEKSSGSVACWMMSLDSSRRWLEDVMFFNVAQFSPGTNEVIGRSWFAWTKPWF